MPENKPVKSSEKDLAPQSAQALLALKIAKDLDGKAAVIKYSIHQLYSPVEKDSEVNRPTQ